MPHCGADAIGQAHGNPGHAPGIAPPPGLHPSLSAAMGVLTLSRRRERLYIAALVLSVGAAALLGLMLWEERRPPARLVIGVEADARPR